MPKADLVLPNGTKLTISDGTTEEIARIAKLLGDAATEGEPVGRKTKRTSKPVPAKSAQQKQRRLGPTAVIVQLRDEGYFKQKRKLEDVQAKLEERGQIYSRTAVAQFLLQLTRRHPQQMRRIKEGAGEGKRKRKIWMYVY